MPLTDLDLLDLIGDVLGLLDIDEFRVGLLLALLAVLPSRLALLTDVGLGPAVTLAEPRLAASWLEKLARFAEESPLYQRLAATGDGRPIRLSDVETREELEATNLFREVYSPLGLNHQISFTLTYGARGVLTVVLSRGGRDYTNGERDFLDQARPYLTQAFRNACDYSYRGREPFLP
ncbi:MAG TPA: hypothetical protein VGF21_12355 [Thermoleophilaceae bacterium]|jgi:hypothetical protein